MRPVSELKQWIEDEIGRMSFNSEPRDLYDPITYMLSLEAKRMRPVLVLCGCDMFSGDLRDAIMPAIGIEVFHNFTLLHDDIMDNAPLRRNRSTVHTRWNTNIAILSGDTMFVKSCQLMMMTSDRHVREVMELFHQTAVEVCEGQQLDMDFEKQHDVSIPDYIHMISNKTAVLLGASLKTGAIIAGASREDANHLYAFGKSMGIAFQLKDDILDVFGDDKKFGKVKGGDIIANKKTYLLLKAMELATGEEARELDNLLNDRSAPADEKVAAVTRTYEKLGVRALAETEMNACYEDALRHLDSIRVEGERKAVLRGFAEKLMVREV